MPGRQLECSFLLRLKSLKAVRQQLRKKLADIQGGSPEADLALAAKEAPGCSTYMALVSNHYVNHSCSRTVQTLVTRMHAHASVLGSTCKSLHGTLETECAPDVENQDSRTDSQTPLGPLACFYRPVRLQLHKDNCEGRDSWFPDTSPPQHDSILCAPQMYRAGQKRIAQSALAALSQEVGGLLREMQGMKAEDDHTSQGPAGADSCTAEEQSCDGTAPKQHSRGQQQKQQRQGSEASATEPPYYVTVETMSTTEQYAPLLYTKHYWPEERPHPALGSSHLQVLSALLLFLCFPAVHEMQSAPSLARDLLMVYHARSSATCDIWRQHHCSPLSFRAVSAPVSSY
jgi:hypothetical protein